MPQVNYPIMVSIDWLELFCESRFEFHKTTQNVDFVLKNRPFGSKMWEYITDVFVEQNGVFDKPFAVVCSGLRGRVKHQDACSVKVANNILYDDNLWELFYIFLRRFGLVIRSLTRVDIAADFLFLNGRISGRQLVNNIKTLKWWKCGTSKVSEHYTMPYSIKWAKDSNEQEYQVYPVDDALTPRTESMTFGTGSSLAQVCIYDKTLELQSHTYNGVCTKEYIRAAWVNAGVYDKTRHTWRVEIRLKNKALTITDYTKGLNELRPVCIRDLLPPHLKKTFRAAADVWFRLVDATNGGAQAITSEYIKKKAPHKASLPVVDLFPLKNLEFAFAKTPYLSNPNRYIHSVCNKIREIKDGIKERSILSASESDPLILERATNIIEMIYGEFEGYKDTQDIDDVLMQEFLSLVLKEEKYRKMDQELPDKLVEQLRVFECPDSPLKPEIRYFIRKQHNIPMFNNSNVR